MNTKKLAWLLPVTLLAGPLSAMAQQYAVTDLGTLGGSMSGGGGINASGQVTGYAQSSGNVGYHAFIYSNGAMEDLGTFGGTFSEGNSINASGQVTGDAYTNGNAADHAFLYSNGSMQDLGTLGGSYSEGEGINANGQVTGTSYTAGNVSSYAFLYGNGTMRSLGTPGGASSTGNGINASGQVTGDAVTAGNAVHAFIYSDGAMRDLGTLGGSFSYGDSINASGQVTGDAATTGGADHAFLYSNGTMRDLGTLGGASSTPSAGKGINVSGQVTGYASTAANAEHAFLYSNGVMTDLNSLLSTTAGSLYTLTEGVAINDNGQIVADGYVDGTGQNVAFLLSPVPAPATAWLMAIGIGALIAFTRSKPHARALAYSTDTSIAGCVAGHSKSRLNNANTRLTPGGFVIALLLEITFAINAHADDAKLSALYTFEVADPNTGASPLGSQPDTRPVLGPNHSVYGMTYTGGVNGNGVIYRYDLQSREYKVLHTFAALDANGANDDGANPGVALTRGPDDVFYGMASFGGAHGNGTIFKITAAGKFTVLHTFGALDSSLHNEDGANPLRALVIGDDGNLYGTTRLGGHHTCGPKSTGCGVAWVMTRWGSFSVIHQFKATEGHAASLMRARDGYFYGCAVWPFATAGSGILYRMSPGGHHFEVLYRFTPVDGSGNNMDGANCYEPLVEKWPGDFYGAAYSGGPNGNGTVFRYSLANPAVIETVHAFSATNAAGENPDGANPYARLTRSDDGDLYSTASYGGEYGNGVVYRIAQHGKFEVLHTFSATDPTTGSNADGANPDYGVLFDEENDRLIGMADYGGLGSVAGAIGNGTLYQLKFQ